MKSTLSSILLAVAALSNLVIAGDKTIWSTTTCWETKYPDKEPPKTYYSTVYVPTEVTKYQQVPTTVYQNVPTTLYENVPTTVYQNVPTTIYVTQVISATVVNSETVYNTIVNSETVYNTIVNSETVYNTIQNTVTQVATQVQATTDVQVVTVTNVVPTTVSVSAVCPTSSTLSGLVLCPSRIVNPTYTPATPLPSNYLWGCPPGSICQPTKENCNFERNTPADTYYCPPEQCQKAGPLPPLQSILDLVDGGNNCAWLTPDPGYFDIDPTPFGYTYAIFNIFGQPQCPAKCPAPSTVTVTETAQAQAPPPVTVTVTVTVTVSAPVVVPPPPPPSSKTPTYYPPSSTWQTWSEPAPVVTSSDWQTWQKGSATKSWGGKVTPRAVLDERAILYPKPCYTLANFAQKIFQGIGSNSVELCPPASPFSVAYGTALACYSSNRAVMPAAIVTVLESAVTYCSNNPYPTPAKREADVHFSPRRNRRMQNGAL